MYIVQCTYYSIHTYVYQVNQITLKYFGFSSFWHRGECLSVVIIYFKSKINNHKP